jgi:anti-sigma regulatory factor (Ser/Thr protein kinase)
MTGASEMETNRLVLRNDLAELDRLASWLEGWADENVAPDASFALQLCLEEAVANIIMHGAASEDRSEIAVEVEHDGATLRASVEDGGRQFDPTRYSPPSPATSLANARVGELGIRLMRNFAGEMRYERRGGRNRSTFWFGGATAAAA